jgi:hypothetical protein
MNAMQRAQAPTPPFFKRLQAIGLTLATVSTAILTLPVTLPATLLTIAAYTAVAGTVASGVSQLAVDDREKAQSKKVIRNKF